MILYTIYRTDDLGPRKWQTFTDQHTADYNRERWQAREDQNEYRPYGRVTFTLEQESTE